MWTSHPSDHGGFWVKFRGEVRAWCPTKEQADEMIDEKSGAKYNRLPTVNPKDLEIIPGKKIKTAKGWYSHTVYKLNGQELGRVQTKCEQGRTTIITLYKDSCVHGHQLKWLLEQNGFRIMNQG